MPPADRFLRLTKSTELKSRMVLEIGEKAEPVYIGYRCSAGEDGNVWAGGAAGYTTGSYCRTAHLAVVMVTRVHCVRACKNPIW